MSAYTKTYKRHRVLFTLPAILLAALAAAYAFTAPKAYLSQASLWIDNPPTTQTSVGNANQAVTPSTEEQTLLNELLATQSFDLAVANGSPLKGTGSNLTIAKKVLTGTTSTVSGPQVLGLGFAGSTPATAQGVLGSVIHQLQQQTSQFGTAFNQGAETYYRGQDSLAKKAAAKATAAANAYLTVHRKATIQSNPSYAALMSSVTAANAQVATDTSELNQAIGQTHDPGAAGLLVRVVDTPVLPTAPKSGKKKIVELGVAGLIGGAVLSLLIVVLITPGGEDRWDVAISETHSGQPSDVSAIEHMQEPLTLMEGGSADTPEVGRETA